jgi:mono/diheme cytochrome c family protein
MTRTLIMLALAGVTTCANAADDDLWTSKVQPLLTERCSECHGAKKAKHNLRLDSLEAILKGGKELGPAIIAGKPDESPLIKVCLMPRGEELAMPPKDPALTAEQIGWLKAWILAGAKAP